jgi:uroporphyrinogen-III synthase
MRNDDVGKANPVVITRPAAQAGVLCERVRAIRPVIAFPLLEIQPLADTTSLVATLHKLHQFSLVVFVSPNAIDASFKWIKQWPPEVAIGVVGQGSLLALAKHGVHPESHTIYFPADLQQSDSEGLLAALPLKTMHGQHALIVRGQQGRDLIASTLTQHGMVVQYVTAYCRSVPVLTEQRRAQIQMFLNGRFDFVFTSSEALRNLVLLVREVAGEPGVVKMQQQRIIATHNRISDIARSLGFRHVIMSGTGDEQIIATLQSLT